MSKNISSALVKAQKEFGPALKTSTNPHYRSKYADLSACVEAVIEALNNNGIFLMQVSHESDSGVIIETLFIHESGEQLSCGKFHVPTAKNDAQGYGSALTYARRYSLMAACGIAPEDDDGYAASKPKQEKKPESSKPVVQVDYESLEEGRKRYVEDIAEAVRTAFAFDIESGYQAWMKNKPEDVTEQSACWGLLASNIRSAIKKYGLMQSQTKGEELLDA